MNGVSQRRRGGNEKEGNGTRNYGELKIPSESKYRKRSHQRIMNGRKRSKEKGATEGEQTENSRTERVANCLDNYGQIKEVRGKGTTKLDIRGSLEGGNSKPR